MHAIRVDVLATVLLMDERAWKGEQVDDIAEGSETRGGSDIKLNSVRITLLTLFSLQDPVSTTVEGIGCMCLADTISSKISHSPEVYSKPKCRAIHEYRIFGFLRSLLGAPSIWKRPFLAPLTFSSRAAGPSFS